MKSHQKILLLGIGSIGGIIAGKLLLANYDCTLVTNNETITKILIKDGLRILEGSNKETIIIEPSKVHTNTCFIRDKFDLIFYMMKTAQVENAISQSKHLLNSGGFVVAFQNGIVESLYENHFLNKVIIASVIFNSIMLSPGVYSLSKSEQIIIGKNRSRVANSSLENVREILSKITSCDVSQNMEGIYWSKLAINCSINAITAISGKYLGQLLKIGYCRDIFFSIYRETIDVADKLGIKLEKIKIDPYMLYSDEQTPFFKKCIQLLFIKQIAKSYATVFPSMLQDLKKGKKTEIDYLNGYVSKLGKELGIKTPINDEMTSLIKKIELNYLTPDISLLKKANDVQRIEKSNFLNSQPS